MAKRSSKSMNIPIGGTKKSATPTPARRSNGDQPSVGNAERATTIAGMGSTGKAAFNAGKGI